MLASTELLLDVHYLDPNDPHVKGFKRMNQNGRYRKGLEGEGSGWASSPVARAWQCALIDRLSSFRPILYNLGLKNQKLNRTRSDCLRVCLVSVIK